MRKCLALTMIIFVLFGLSLSFAIQPGYDDVPKRACDVCMIGGIDETRQDPTCTESGYVIYDCDYCDYYYYRELAPAHSWDSTSNYYCTEYITCSSCGEVSTTTKGTKHRMFEVYDSATGSVLYKECIDCGYRIY